MKLNTTDEILEDFRQGKMVLILDDEDRENEGDLVIAAEVVTPCPHYVFRPRSLRPNLPHRHRIPGSPVTTTPHGRQQ